MKVIIAIGSNTHPAAHIQWAARRLSNLLHNLRLSRRLWTQDIKGTGVWYMNLLAYGTTTLSAEDLEQQLKAIETETRRTKGHVTLDIDLMQYGNTRYHELDWPRPYIQQLISDIL